MPKISEPIFREVLGLSLNLSLRKKLPALNLLQSPTRRKKSRLRPNRKLRPRKNQLNPSRPSPRPCHQQSPPRSKVQSRKNKKAHPNWAAAKTQQSFPEPGHGIDRAFCCLNVEQAGQLKDPVLRQVSGALGVFPGNFQFDGGCMASRLC